MIWRKKHICTQMKRGELLGMQESDCASAYSAVIVLVGKQKRKPTHSCNTKSKRVKSFQVKDNAKLMPFSSTQILIQLPFSPKENILDFPYSFYLLFHSLFLSLLTTIDKNQECMFYNHSLIIFQ